MQKIYQKILYNNIGPSPVNSINAARSRKIQIFMDASGINYSPPLNSAIISARNLRIYHPWVSDFITVNNILGKE